MFLMLLHPTLNLWVRLWHGIRNLVPQGTPCHNSPTYKSISEPSYMLCFAQAKPPIKRCQVAFPCWIRACGSLLSCSQILIDTFVLLASASPCLYLRHSTSIVMCLSGVPTLVCKLLSIGPCLNVPYNPSQEFSDTRGQTGEPMVTLIWSDVVFA